ncbi:MAG: modulated transcriptional regulator, LuxR family [Frankiales bacterium]|nr:modulated transcriptional regulator, LuxR family [Frankiales bacterium]MCW3015486.1 modulated transcriptional regulator, LuxR family [Solirubrobacterales bacterium]
MASATTQDVSETSFTTLERSAQSLAQRARELIDSHTLATDPAYPDELAERLEAVCEQLRTQLLEDRSIAREPLKAAALCDALVELTDLQQDLRETVIAQRFEVLARIHGGLTRLRGLGSVAELLKEAPEELCHCCDFDRAVLSRVHGSSWRPEVICIAAGQDPEVTRATEEFLTGAEIPLSPMLLETELARRGAPALVSDAQANQRTYSPLMQVSDTKAYVATPVLQGRRVIGFLHADTYGSGRELTTLDRDNLWTFAEGFGLIFERMVLVERLGEQRVRVKTAFRTAEADLDRLCDAEVKLARQEEETQTVARSAAGMLAPTESRINLLLTAREREVLNLMIGGARNSTIADELVIAEGTVKSHVKNICRKLRASNRAEAVSKYLQIVMRSRL